MCLPKLCLVQLLARSAERSGMDRRSDAATCATLGIQPTCENQSHGGPQSPNEPRARSGRSVRRTFAVHGRDDTLGNKECCLELSTLAWPDLQLRDFEDHEHRFRRCLTYACSRICSAALRKSAARRVGRRPWHRIQRLVYSGGGGGGANAIPWIKTLKAFLVPAGISFHPMSTLSGTVSVDSIMWSLPQVQTSIG